MDNFLNFLPLLLGLLVGYALLAGARRQDHRAWIYARAPQLTIARLSVHDDAWLRGLVRCAQPLSAPHFGTPCVRYDYRIEERRTRTRVDKDGRVNKEVHWETVHSESKAIPFELDDGSGQIAVAGERAEIKAGMVSQSAEEFFGRRHVVTILPLESQVSVLGVKLDDGVFGPLREIPLLLTTREAAEFVRRSQRGEHVWRGFAYAMPWIGGSITWHVLNYEHFSFRSFLISAGVGLLCVTPVWAVATYNRLVRLRQQRRAAWNQIGVDLTVRDELLPHLVAVVAGYQAHEAKTLQDVASWRSGNDVNREIRHDDQAHQAAKTIFALAERYPELRAQPLFADLHGRLWALEEKLAHSRKLYNDVAKEWNDLVAQLPTNLVAMACGEQPSEYFQIDAATAQPPGVGKA